MAAPPAAAAAAAATLLRAGRPTLISACRGTPRRTGRIPFACFHTAPAAAATATSASRRSLEAGAGLGCSTPRLCFSSEAGGRGGGEHGSENGGVVGAIGKALRFKSIVEGREMLPEGFEGKAVLVVNTASLCGLTPQLKELELVHQRFRKDGLLVLGVPSNDFGGQEPWEEEKIKEFYKKDFGVTFPLTSKVELPQAARGHRWVSCRSVRVELEPLRTGHDRSDTGGTADQKIAHIDDRQRRRGAGRGGGGAESQRLLRSVRS